MADQPEITTIGQKGQVVIPLRIREHLGVDARTKFLVFEEGGMIILKRLELPDVRKHLRDVLARIAQKKVRISSSGVAAEVRAARRARHLKE